MIKVMKTGNTAYKAAIRLAIATGIILLLPLIAMQFTDEVVWDLADFAAAGVLLFGTGLAYELMARKGGTVAYRAAVGVALATVFLLVWVNAAVGIIGSENNDANLMYFGVLSVGIIGAILARLQPLGMARALFVTALAQALVPVIALTIWQPTSWGAAGVFGVFVLNAFFVMLLVGSALLFKRAAYAEEVPSAIQNTSEKLKMHTLISVITIAIGVVLMIYMIFVEDEPGGIPLLLIVFGIGGYFVTRVRIRSHQK
ncbi:MAG: hypothetical protein U9N31_06800 [Candidatus Marinimicrobia bacterium]|nr:hypothetical protein [Candidatus Neomarinimicrobiota bacterium]